MLLYKGGAWVNSRARTDEQADNHDNNHDNVRMSLRHRCAAAVPQPTSNVDMQSTHSVTQMLSNYSERSTRFFLGW